MIGETFVNEVFIPWRSVISFMLQEVLIHGRLFVLIGCFAILIYFCTWTTVYGVATGWYDQVW